MPQRSISLFFEHVTVARPVLCLAALLLLPRFASHSSLGCIKRCCRVTRQAVASKRCLHAFKIFNSCLVIQVPSWLRDALMWCCGLPEDMAGISWPASWAEAAIWLPGSQLEQTLTTRLPTQGQPEKPHENICHLTAHQIAFADCKVYTCLDA